MNFNLSLNLTVELNLKNISTLIKNFISFILQSLIWLDNLFELADSKFLWKSWGINKNTQIHTYNIRRDNKKPTSNTSFIDLTISRMIHNGDLDIICPINFSFITCCSKRKYEEPLNTNIILSNIRQIMASILLPNNPYRVCLYYYPGVSNKIQGFYEFKSHIDTFFKS